MQVWYKRFIPIFLFSLVLLSSLAFAQPSLKSVEFRGDTGLELDFPIITILKQSSSYDFHFHVFNLTNGVFITDVTCFFHLYNASGNHILKLNTSIVEGNFDYAFNVGGSNFSNIGEYSYITQCNKTGLGGFVEVSFEVTATGKEAATQNNEDELFLYFIAAISLILLIIAFYKEDHNLATISGMLLLLLGVYIMNTGFSALTNGVSNSLGIVLICVGFYIMLRSNIENF